jgi:hypothetical protein
MQRSGIVLVLIALVAIAASLAIPAMAARTYGRPAAGLSAMQVLEHSARLLWDDGLLTMPRDPDAPEQAFRIEQGEALESIAGRLEQEGILREADALQGYLSTPDWIRRCRRETTS